MIKYRKQNVIEENDWNDLIIKTYNRPYNFQQQDGCKSRGVHHLTVPSKYAETQDAEMYDSIPEIVNGVKMGVKFKVWLERDPKQSLPDKTNTFGLRLFWARNFYPDVDTIANDLHKKGLIDEGDYVINIDW